MLSFSGELSNELHLWAKDQKRRVSKALHGNLRAPAPGCLPLRSGWLEMARGTDNHRSGSFNCSAIDARQRGKTAGPCSCSCWMAMLLHLVLFRFFCCTEPRARHRQEEQNSEEKNIVLIIPCCYIKDKIRSNAAMA